MLLHKTLTKTKNIYYHVNNIKITKNNVLKKIGIKNRTCYLVQVESGGYVDKIEVLSFWVIYSSYVSKFQKKPFFHLKVGDDGDDGAQF